MNWDIISENWLAISLSKVFMVNILYSLLRTFKLKASLCVFQVFLFLFLFVFFVFLFSVEQSQQAALKGTISLGGKEKKKNVNRVS